MPQGIYRQIGWRIAELRREQGVIQEQLAEKVDRNASYLARIETGARHATVETLDLIPRALGHPVGAIFPLPQEPELPRDFTRALRGLRPEDLKLLACCRAGWLMPTTTGWPMCIAA